MSSCCAADAKVGKLLRSSGMPSFRFGKKPVNLCKLMLYSFKLRSIFVYQKYSLAQQIKYSGRISLAFRVTETEVYCLLSLFALFKLLPAFF